MKAAPKTRRRSPIDVFQYLDYRAFLADFYKLKKKNGFSYRAFSRAAGLGAPIYAKLDSELASAMMSINAVKAVEIGDGFATAAMTGEQNADEMRHGNDGKPVFLSNHAGGILGGISTGQPIVARFAVKPTSSILAPRRTIDKAGTETEIVTKGRHDPCVGIRAVPVGEAMQLAVGLQQRGYDPELVFCPDEGHGFAKLSNRLLFSDRMVKFLDATIGK